MFSHTTCFTTYLQDQLKSVIIPFGKLTWQWKMDLLKMYSLLKMGIFHCHVSLLKGINYWWFRHPKANHLTCLKLLIETRIFNIYHQFFSQPINFRCQISRVDAPWGSALRESVASSKVFFQEWCAKLVGKTCGVCSETLGSCNAKCKFSVGKEIHEIVIFLLCN